MINSCKNGFYERLADTAIGRDGDQNRCTNTGVEENSFERKSFDHTEGASGYSHSQIRGKQPSASFKALSLFSFLLLREGQVDAFVSPIRRNPSLPYRTSPICSEGSEHFDEESSALEHAKKESGPFQGFQEFFQELDYFVDDAFARRLGQGSTFYGKRKSKFYGKKDPHRKVDAKIPCPLEDYQGPMSGGRFEWMPDKNGDLRPVTRMKKTVIERNPTFWDKFYKKEQE